MDEHGTERRVAKILSDLLALTLSENDPQSEAAIGAIRRRAARDAVTGGAVKDLATRLLHERGEAPPDAAGEREANGLRWTIADQQRDLDEARQARRLADAAAADARQANAALVERLGQAARARRAGWLYGALLGGFSMAMVAGAAWLAWRPRPDASSFAAAGADTHTPSNDAVIDFLHSCFLSSSNSLGGGDSFAMHLLIDLGADGRIADVRLAPDQLGLLADPDRRRFSELVLRTFANGGCGSLPLPPSLRGRAGRLDVRLPR